MLTPAANGMPIMFYAFFIFGRRGKERTTEVRKGWPRARVGRASRTSITRTDLAVGVPPPSGWKNRISMSALQSWRRSRRPALRDHGMTTCSHDSRACRDIRLSWCPRDFIASPPRRAFIVNKLITRNKSERHAEQVIDPRGWGGSGIMPRCRRNDCR